MSLRSNRRFFGNLGPKMRISFYNRRSNHQQITGPGEKNFPRHLAQEEVAHLCQCQVRTKSSLNDQSPQTLPKLRFNGRENIQTSTSSHRPSTPLQPLLNTRKADQHRNRFHDHQTSKFVFSLFLFEFIPSSARFRPLYHRDF
jgi:hypothetical protein